MNVLWLGLKTIEMENFMHLNGDAADFTEEKIAADSDLLRQKEYLVSFGYRHILTADVLTQFPRRAVNIHISLLPWNRGADPNFWSFLEDTPKGVSIHYLTDRLDAGDILCQQEIFFDSEATLRSSYDILMDAAKKLFMRHWDDLKASRIKSRPQTGAGSFHQKKDMEPYRSLLHQGWDTPVKEFAGAWNPKKV